jgi:hypothetical protein
VLPQLSNHVTEFTSGYRTNIGFFNPNTAPVTVRLELRNSDGTLTASSLMTLQALSQQQNPIASYFSGGDITDAANLTLSFDASAPVVAYASVVDNVSANQIFVSAQEDVGVATVP